MGPSITLNSIRSDSSRAGPTIPIVPIRTSSSSSNPSSLNHLSLSHISSHQTPEENAGMEDATEHHADTSMPSSQQQEEVLKKKYGLVPKKPPLISKDHERAYFDSADWALGKQKGSEKPKGPLEALRPKLQVSPSHIS
ncbi:hypothetical protein QQ045_004767 [Rhodiola kirilowii]